MAEDSESPPNPNPNPNPNPKDSKRPSVCEECGEKPWKYRCPGCSLVSCSLPCVQSHKRRTSCDGKRRRTDFVPLRHFDDNLLLSDYNFLEETKRVTESAQRLIAGYGGYVGNNLPMRLRMLRKAAYRRKTQLFFLPLGMSKREKNRSIYNHRKNSIFWTLEWRFNSTDIVLLDHGIDENAKLSISVEKHLSPSPWKDKLTQFRNLPLNDLKLFVQKSAKAAKSPYRELNIRAPLGPQLKNVLVVEYPVIHVFLPSHSCDFEIEKGTNLFVEHNETSDHDVVPKGSVFKEEEIEEGEMTSETQVLDNIIDYKIPNSNGVKTSSGSNFGSQPKRRKENFGNGGHVKDPNLELNDITRLQNVSNCTHLRENNDAIRVFEYENFDFEQEMRDAYSDLLGEMNPDDFLCLDDGYSEEEGSKECKNAQDYGAVLFGAEELEEGEIPSLQT